MATAATVVGLAAAAAAGPLNRDWVPSDATWVVHVDMETGVGSSVGRFLVENRGAWGPNDWERFRERTGIDPATDIKGVTIFGPTCDEQHAVAVVDATSATDSFLSKLRAKEKSFERVKGERYTLDTWREHGSQRFGYVRKDGDRRLILVGRDRARVEEAIDRTESQKASESPALSTMPREGSFLFVAAMNVGTAAEGGKAVMVQKMKDLRLDFGESGDELYGTMVVTTGTEQEARDVLQMLEGAAAMGRMMAQSRPELADMVEASRSLALSASDSSVRASFAMESSKALGMLKTLAEKRASAKGGPGQAERGTSTDEDRGAK